ncbi:oxidoreductase [Oleomonas cavernae]|uniref:oxidoreductase n=1 Tax=Oleomonas cavernae TaxID=2320859 RepID=UPI0026CB7282
MKSGLSTLFSPFTINGLTLANRIVMAPMTRSRSPGGIPGADVAAYYRRRAENDVGLIITEGTTIDHAVSSMDVNVPNFYGPAREGWRRVVAEVHEAGGRIMPQLWHVGMARNPKSPNAPLPGQPSVGPSGLVVPGKKVAEPMRPEEIRAVVDGFARGAADARDLGFDGVEIHGAHGYLIDQFFWAGLNERADNYGGDARRRQQMAIDIIEAIRHAVGPTIR